MPERPTVSWPHWSTLSLIAVVVTCFVTIAAVFYDIR